MAVPIEERRPHKHRGRVYEYQGNRKYVATYRKKVEAVIGRRLKPSEVIHHINCNPDDCRNSNLLICDQSYHKWLHERMSKLYAQEHFAQVNI